MAFISWSDKLDKLEQDVITFHRTGDEDKADIGIKYEDKVQMNPMQKHIYTDDYGDINYAEIVLYKNAV